MKQQPRHNLYKKLSSISHAADGQGPAESRTNLEVPASQKLVQTQIYHNLQSQSKLISVQVNPKLMRHTGSKSPIGSHQL